MNIAKHVKEFQSVAQKNDVKIVAVSKTKPPEDIMQAYQAGQTIFGENKAQELVSKYESLPREITWHMIGHLQRNKVKYIVPFVDLIQSVDSLRLLKEVNKQAAKIDRKVNVLLQIHIAEEESKFGFSQEEVLELLNSQEIRNFKNITIKGLMGMATFTDDTHQVRKEFRSLKSFFEQIRSGFDLENVSMEELSMGMSGDYQIAIEEGSTMIRVGSSIFGSRNY